MRKQPAAGAEVHSYTGVQPEEPEQVQVQVREPEQVPERVQVQVLQQRVFRS